MRQLLVHLILLAAAFSAARAGETAVVSLQDFCKTEVKGIGIDVRQRTEFHVRARGGGGDYGWTYKSDRLFAYGWIINADTRELVWRMEASNSTRSGDDRTFDGSITLEPGSYEVYFCAYGFTYHSWFSHITANADRRNPSLFGPRDEQKKGMMSWFKGWWSEDFLEKWHELCKTWGIQMLVDEASRSAVATFDVPREPQHCVVNGTPMGDLAIKRWGFSVSAPTRFRIDALGEMPGGHELADHGWIVDLSTRDRIWEMDPFDVSHAGGAEKNVRCEGTVLLKPGKYVLYYITDDSHSMADWNAEPPDDPYHWGILLSVESEADRKHVELFDYTELNNVIVSLTKVGDSEYRNEGFTLKKDTDVRVYAIGERSNTRSEMADYGAILDVKTRKKVWSMDVERTVHAGGASKNRLIDEIITLPKGSYLVMYQTDDSHAYNDWNMDPPYDANNYGITVMGSGEGFSSSVVGKYVEERDRNVIAQIVRVGDDADRRERFTLDRTARVRIYAIGEGQNREMYDYGWIENARSGQIVWEMTYGMTFHAGGGRKNRSVNTTLLLEKGEYVLRYRSDDSHSFGEWNVDPPEDPPYWGITVYRDDVVEAPPEAPARPSVPAPPKSGLSQAPPAPPAPPELP